MDTLIPVHHSLTDWLFETGKNWFISTVKFVSSPSSLARPNAFYTTIDGHFALKEAVSGNLKDGRAITYFHAERTDIRQLRCIVRAQTSPHLGMPSNCYMFTATQAVGRLTRVVSGSSNTLKEVATPFVWNINTWYRFRFTWYTFFSPSLETTLRLIIEYELAGTWTPWLSYDEANPQWEASATNLLGFWSSNGNTDSRTFWDDTLVYKRA